MRVHEETKPSIQLAERIRQLARKDQETRARNNPERAVRRRRNKLQVVWQKQSVLSEPGQVRSEHEGGRGAFFHLHKTERITSSVQGGE